MQVSLDQNNLLQVPQQQEGHSVETPVKRSKGAFHSQLKTAETPTMSLSAAKPSLAEVDAQELFDNFSRIVTVSESREEL